MVYDLSTEWFALTGLPFVFRFLFSSTSIGKGKAKGILLYDQGAIEVGINNLDQVIEEWFDENPRKEIKKIMRIIMII